jgi:hypothetical protein
VATADEAPKITGHKFRRYAGSNPKKYNDICAYNGTCERSAAEHAAARSLQKPRRKPGEDAPQTGR